MLAATWILLSVLVGFLGRHRRIGFVGFFLLALVFTPIVALLVLVVTAPKTKSTTI